jgi:tetratricopeptide (TPR) repeat protein
MAKEETEEKPMDRLKVAVEEISRLVGEGHNDKAIDKIMAFKASPQVNRLVLVQALLTHGQKNKLYPLVQVTLDAFERLKSKPVDALTYYNVATSYEEKYERLIHDDKANVFDCEETISRALKYFSKGSGRDPRMLTNFGNMYDALGRSVEAIDLYERALLIDPDFGMASGNKAYAVERLATIVGRYGESYLVYAYQLYMHALSNSDSVKKVGGQQSIKFFEQHSKAIHKYFSDKGKEGNLGKHLTHKPYDDSNLSKFVKFYTAFCVDNGLYLNLHIQDKLAQASIGDRVVPRIITNTGDNEQEYVKNIMLRLNEVIEVFMTARMHLVRSQFTDEDFSNISQQTTLVNNLDYSVSNIYVGYLKSAYKEAFGVLDKIAILLNHYLELGLPEDRFYYHNVWYEDYDSYPDKPSIIFQNIKDEKHSLYGLYLLCSELKASKYYSIRNDLTHRYLRVYRAVDGPKGTYAFEELTTITTEVLYKVKCAIIYITRFIESKERRKLSSKRSGFVPTIPLNTDQNLDIW